MTFEELSKLVAEDFKATMKSEGFKTFDEMKRCYCWEACDVKDEVYYIINEIAEKVWKESKLTVWMSDDRTFIQIGCSDMSWREFKKLVFANLKNDNVDDED